MPIPNAKHVEFNKALGIWALAVLKDGPTAVQHQDPCVTVLRPLKEAIEAKILSIPERDTRPQADWKFEAEGWSVDNLFE